MKIFYRQQFISPGFDPFILLLPVAHRTMTIAATVVMIMNMSALRVIALILMISHGSGAALSNFCKYLP
jgi:uncharacterized membrane protein